MLGRIGISRNSAPREEIRGALSLLSQPIRVRCTQLRILAIRMHVLFNSGQ